MEDALNGGKHEEAASPKPNTPPDFGVPSSWSPKAIELMQAGVTLTDPANSLIDPEVEVGQDTVILPGCTLRGNTRIGSDCKIGPHVTIIASEIGQGSTVKSSCWIENMTIAPGTTIDPFQRLVGPKAAGA